MTRRDDTGGLLEGDGAEDTFIDGVGDNTGAAEEQSRGQSLEQRLLEEEPDLMDDAVADPDGRGRRDRRDIRQLVTGGSGSHSRTDPDLIGLDAGDADVSAEESALHLVSDRERARGTRSGDDPAR